MTRADGSQADTEGLLRTAAAELRVLIVGSLNTDVLIALDNMPGNDGSAIVSDVHEGFGGHAGNCASALAALGVGTTLLAAVGDDASGRAATGDLSRRGINTAHIYTARAATGRVFILSTPAYRAMFMERAANEHLPVQTLDCLDPAAYTAVEASISVMWACARCAMNRCWAAGMTLSCRPSRYQDGMVS